MNWRSVLAIAACACPSVAMAFAPSACTPASADVARVTPSKSAARKTEIAEAANARAPVVATRVLHCGDSTVGGGLSHALRRIFLAQGAAYTRDSKRSMAIRTFARTRHFEEMLATVDPDLVVLTLGTNDVFDPHPEALAAAVETIAARATAPSPSRPEGGARRCYWIGPPTWRGNTGIVDVVRAHAAPCVFFDSSDMKNVARLADGIHPSERGGATWALSFWEAYEGRPPTDDERRTIRGSHR